MNDPKSILSESFFPVTYTHCQVCREALTIKQAMTHDCTESGKSPISPQGEPMAKAALKKMAEVLDLDEKQIEDGYTKIKQRYPAIQRYRNKLYERFTPLRQEKGTGTEIKWVEPDEYIENIFGIKRFFTLEWSVIRYL